MYKAVHRDSGEEILTLHPAWRGRKDDLRQMAGEGLLLCQGCRQPVRLKAGAHKRPHFAHRHLQGCTLGQESPRLLAARACLYEWLVEGWAGRSEAEVSLPGVPRPADVVLYPSADASPESLAGGVVFWVADVLLKQETRANLRAAFEEAGLRPVWILDAHLMRLEEGQQRRIYLSPCERDWLRQTAYDEIGRENHLLDADFGSSLHYLDAESGRLITFRSLERVHAPNIYVGRREECPLKDVLVDSEGEPFYRGEERALHFSRRARAQQAERVKRWLQPSPPALQGALPMPGSSTGPQGGPSQVASLTPAREISREKVTCIYCGEFTDDWWTAWSEEGERLGKCRACLDKGLG